MAKQKLSTITKEQLLANGWVETTDPVIPISKNLTDKSAEGYDPDEGEIRLVLHGYHNAWVFGLSLPDGGMVNINVASIKELNAFEKMISSYDPPF